MEKQNEMMVLNQNQNEVAINYFGSSANFKDGWNIAGVLAKSDLVPKTFHGKPENCIIAMNMAQRMNADLLMVMQNLVVVHGTPTFEAKFAIACFNATGKYTAIKYKEEGERGKDSWGFRAYAIETKTGEVVEGPLVTIGTAKSEGWYNQNPKWKNVPELMLRYRSASWFIRTTDPGVMMGFQTKEEVEDFTEYEDVTDEQSEIPSDANTETLEVPSEAEEPKTSITEEVKAETAEAKPVGKQKTPEIFN